MSAKERHYLQCTRGSTRERGIIPLKGNEVIVGRKEIRSVHISRNHAAFRRCGEGWTVTSMGQNAMLLDGRPLVRNAEYPLGLESEIRFTEHEVSVYKLMVSPMKGCRQDSGTSGESQENQTQGNKSSGVKGEMGYEYMEVEQQLRGSAALQAQLKEKSDLLQQALLQQQKNLSEKYEKDRTELEEQFQRGALAQQAMLEEKELLAQNLQEEITKLLTELEGERKVVEDRLRQEEEKNKILQEKENELRQLAEEKASLEEKQEEERQRLQKQLLDTETHKEELRQQVAAKNSAIQVKEAEYQLAKEERQRLEERLEEERLTREAEKYEMQKQLMVVKAQEQHELKDTLDALKAEKEKLEADLASSNQGTSEAKKEVVESVSHVLEDEFQCAICNELFINAVLLNCSHTFCKHCINRWKQKKKDCPNCRLPITSESRSLVVDNFIEKIVPTLSEELKTKRAQIVAERNAEEKAAEQAAAEQAAAAATTRATRTRGRGRSGRGRAAQRGRPVLVHSTNIGNTTPAAASNNVNNPVQYISIVGNRGAARLEVQAASVQTLPNNRRIVRIHVPASEVRALHSMPGTVRVLQPSTIGQGQPGSSSNPFLSHRDNL